LRADFLSACRREFNSHVAFLYNLLLPTNFEGVTYRR
jgi:hypothetical protein